MRHFLLLIGLFGIIKFGQSGGDFFTNGLAKVCRPVDRPLDILFIIDGSGSVHGGTFDTQLQMLNRVVDLINISEETTQMAVLQYASYTFTEFVFKTHKTKEALRNGILKIRHKSGTTKTGKALEKAYQLFKDESSGSRRKNSTVGQVAIVVTDGHSHDDPIAKAKKLRSSGVTIIALGIGPHINMNELNQITDNPEYAFSNLTSKESLNRFTTEFKKLAIGEECKFARGTDGAEVKCLSDSINVGVSTMKQFMGHLYIDGQYYDSKCNSKSNSTEVNLKVGLNECGIKRQFSVNPRGFLFEAKVLLQFHPFYSTPQDKTFNVHCFYQDKTHEEQGNEIDWELVKEHAQIKSPDNSMPCEYNILPSDAAEQDCFDKTKMTLGDKIQHTWKCNPDKFDTYQSVLVHSCYLMDVRNDVERLIIDERGCSLDESIIKTPTYNEPLSISSDGILVNHPDGPLVKIRCSLKFCDRLMGECDEILPPKCNPISKRQAGFAVGIIPLGESTDAPPIVTFDPTKIDRTRGFALSRRRISLEQNVHATVGTISVTESPSDDSLLKHTDVKLNTQPVRVVPDSDAITEAAAGITTHLESSTIPSEFEEYSVEIDDSEVTDLDTIKVAEDPFQEQRKLTKTEEAAIERELLNILPELDSNLITKMSTSEIHIESQTISVNPLTSKQ
uniref:Uncharacterized protein n=1 Tax=Panagrolaimus sp. ES5 TaxID=591445 RepID=A0AC34FFN3_9BILA